MKKLVFVSVLIFTLSACTEPGETTGIAAGTGGVIGAGLGAIVGNQTGSAGTGMVVGALAGASAGAAVGNALEAQQQQIRTQDEAIERQEEQLKVQRSELNDLRRSTDDSISYRPRANSDASASARGSFGKPSLADNRNEFKQPVAKSSLREADLVREDVASAQTTNSMSEGVTAARSGQVLNNGSVECIKAETEVKGAERSADAADKLFHYRRALRLCPDNASYHNGLGLTYKDLGRMKDAEFEFKEALRLNPSLEQAQSNLADLNRRG